MNMPVLHEGRWISRQRVNQIRNPQKTLARRMLQEALKANAPGRIDALIAVARREFEQRRCDFEQMRCDLERRRNELDRRIEFLEAARQVVRGPCEVCGTAKTHGHHDDYDKPLTVRWLCGPHHRELHTQLRHAANVQSAPLDIEEPVDYDDADMGKRHLTVKEMGRKGGKAYMANHTKAERSENARRAAKALWAKRRAEKAAV